MFALRLPMRGPGMSTLTRVLNRHFSSSKLADSLIKSAQSRDFPPGEAHKSNTHSPNFGFKSDGAKEVEGS